MFCSVRRNFTQLNLMKRLIFLAPAVAAMAVASTALAGKYDDLVAKGFRWSTADGPYASVAKDDAHRMANHPPDEVILKMVEQVKVFYLTPGTIVQVTEEDPKTGVSKIRMAGITSDLWTLTSFLSKRPLKDTYGVVETPETSGLIPTSTTGLDAGPTPTPTFGPSVTPGTSPVPAMSPEQSMTPEQSMSPEPSLSPTPSGAQ
jgi:hypothetical protein